MIAPLYFTNNAENAMPHSITEPVYCGHCKRSKRQIAILFCKFCSKMSNKQYLCRECDVKVHLSHTRKKHKRHLIVLGSGLTKNIIYSPTHSNITIQFLDNVLIRLSSLSIHSNKIVRENTRYMEFISGTSGNCLHLQLTALQDIPNSSMYHTSMLYMSVQYANKVLGYTRNFNYPHNISSTDIENETFIIPLPPHQNRNSLIRIQLFAILPSISTHVFIGQFRLSLQYCLTTLPKCISSTPCILQLQPLKYSGYITYSIGLCNKYVYIRVDDYHHYIHSVQGTLSPRFTLVYNNKTHVSVRCKKGGFLRVCQNDITQRVKQVATDVLTDVLFEIFVFLGRNSIGKVDVTVDMFLSIYNTINWSELVSRNEVLDSVGIDRNIVANELILDKQYKALMREELGNSAVSFTEESEQKDFTFEQSGSKSRSVYEGSANNSVNASSTPTGEDAADVTVPDVLDNRIGSFRQIIKKVRVAEALYVSVLKLFVTQVAWSLPQLAHCRSDPFPNAQPADSDPPCTVSVKGVFSDKGDIVRGLDVAVSTMRLGEVAEVKCRYDYAYGSNAVGASIPPRTNMIFSVEILRVNNSRIEYDEEFLSKLRGKFWLYVLLLKIWYGIKVRFEKLFGIYDKRKLKNMSKFSEYVSEDDEEGVQVNEVMESSSDEEKVDDAVDGAAIVGAKYMWRKDAKLKE